MEPAPIAPRVLIVEDDTSIREALAECVASTGVEVLTASDGAEGLDRLRSSPAPAAVLLGLRVSGVERNRLLSAMRGDPHLSLIPVISMISPPERPAAPVYAHLSKPFDLDEIGKLLGRLLGGEPAPAHA